MENSSLPKRYWDKVDVRGADECWPWTASTRAFGHGAYLVNGQCGYAHRVMWESIHGPIPEGMCICHSCDVPGCVNPAHLWIGTRADNNRDKMEKGRFVRSRTSLTWELVREIRARLAVPDDVPIVQRIKAMAPEYGVSWQCVNKVYYRERWVEDG